MKKFIILGVIGLLFAFSLTNALAYPVSVGQQIYFDRVGTAGNGSGGEFSVHLYNNGSTSPKLFETFCVETQEFISLGPTHPYYIGGISNDAIKGGAPVSDPLSSQSAYLYNHFISNSLAIGYANNDADANALQDAIWYFEGEGGGTNKYTSEANLNQNGSLYGVQVLNMYTTYDAQTGYSGLAQDMLVVPEPGILILLGIALSTVGLASRRYKI